MHITLWAYFYFRTCHDPGRKKEYLKKESWKKV